jgi:hypothetical protein
MGVWGTGPFDNDEAADLLHYVQKAGRNGWKVVLDCLRPRSSERGHLDVHGPVAAAELVATALGKPNLRDDRRLAFAVGRQTSLPWAKRFGSFMPAGAVELAHKAVLKALRVDLGWTRPADARRWNSNLLALLRKLEEGGPRSGPRVRDPRRPAPRRRSPTRRAFRSRRSR